MGKQHHIQNHHDSPVNQPPSSGCLFTNACVRAAGLSDDCEELQTLR